MKPKILRSLTLGITTFALSVGAITPSSAWAAEEISVSYACGDKPCEANDIAYIGFASGIQLNLLNWIFIFKPYQNKAKYQSTSNESISIAGNAHDETGMAASAERSGLSFWAQAGRNNTAITYSPLRSSGYGDMFALGMNYAFMPGGVAGVSIAQTAQRVTNQYNNNGKTDTDGTTLGGFISYPLAGAWSLNGAAGYTDAKINIIDRTAIATPIRGERKADGHFLSLGSSYAMQHGDWGFIASGDFSSARSNYGAFSFSNGTAATSSSSSYTQAVIGIDGKYRGSWISPTAGLRYVSNLSQPKQTAIQGVAASNDRDYFKVSLGLDWDSPGRLLGSIQYAKDLGYKDIKNESWQIKLGLKF